MNKFEPTPNPDHFQLERGTGNRWKRRMNTAKIVLQNWATQAQVALEIAEKREELYKNCDV